MHYLRPLIILIALLAGCAAPNITASPVTATLIPIPPRDTPAPTITLTPTDIPTTEAIVRPGPMVGFDLLYDPDHEQVLLINGHTEGEVMSQAQNTLWVWRGTEWMVGVEGGLPDRVIGAAVYDTEQQALFVFGGIQLPNTKFSDTWRLRGSWQPLDVEGPSARDHISAAYDESRQQMILYGGAVEGNTLVTDTWGFDGNTWTQLDTEGFGARYHYGIVYHTARQQVMIFGGSNEDMIPQSDLRAWNGSEWVLVDSGTTGPSPRNSMAVAYADDCECIYTVIASRD